MVCDDHPGFAAGKMGNKEIVALQAVSLKISPEVGKMTTFDL
jgi:hypothetical protein